MIPLARPGALSARARAFLAGRGPIPTHDLACEVFATSRIDGALAERLLATLLEGDPCFEHSSTGWRLVSRRPAARRLLAEVELVVVDVETTGGRPPGDRVTEVGAVRVVGDRIVEDWSSLVNPGRPIPWFVQRLTGIDDRLAAAAPSFDEVAIGFLEFLGDGVFVAHNAHFDWRFLNAELLRAQGGILPNTRLCTVRLARALLPHVRRRSLDALAWLFGVTVEGRHRALGDARATARILLHLLDVAGEQGVQTDSDLVRLAGVPGTLPSVRPYEAA